MRLKIAISITQIILIAFALYWSITAYIGGTVSLVWGGEEYRASIKWYSHVAVKMYFYLSIIIAICLLIRLIFWKNNFILCLFGGVAFISSIVPAVFFKIYDGRFLIYYKIVIPLLVCFCLSILLVKKFNKKRISR